MKRPFPHFARVLTLSALMLAPSHAAHKIVFLAGAKSHGPGEHEFRAGCLLLAKALNESGLDVKAEVHSGWPSDEKVLDGTKALIIYADGTSVVGKGWEKVDQMAKAGTGLMFMHYAVHPEKEEGEKYYRPWIGGAFETGYSVNPHWVADLQALPDHPVSRGVGSLVEAYDEFYYNMRFMAERAKVADLVTAVPDRERMKQYINLWNEHGVEGLGRKQTLMWGIQREDGGRGVGFTGGHYHRNWSIDGFRKIVLNAIVWTAGVEVPMDGVISKPLTEEEMNANLDDKGKPANLKPVIPGEFRKIPAAPINQKREAGFPKIGQPKPENTGRRKAPAAPPAGDGTLVPVELFTTPDSNLEVTVWATTPLLKNPTNIDFDADGRLWVAEGVNYRHAKGASPQGDRVVVLSDTDGNGQADRTEVFTQDQNLESPLGIAVIGKQIVVSQPPDLIVYTDVNGDRKFDAAVDKREVLLTGFNARQHDHSLHSVTVGPDGQWNFNFGNCGAVFTDKSGKTFRVGSSYYRSGGGTWYHDTAAIAGQPSDDGKVWLGGSSVRMNPDGTHARIVGHNYRNSYEQALTSFGDLFQSDNDDPPACRVTEVIEGGNAGFSSADGKRSWGADRRPGQDVPTAEWRQEDPGTMPSGDIYGGGSPTGVAFYENGALGDKWQGLLLACEAGKNVIFGYLPVPDGAGFRLERIDFLTSNKERKFAGSDFVGGPANDEIKTLFRPADVAVGPDGAIYVADWFDQRVGGHGTMDKSGSGTIYRVAPKGFKSIVPKIDLGTTEGRIAALKSPAANVRAGGFSALKSQGGKVVPAVAELLGDQNPYIAARAVWLLAQLGDSGQKIVADLLSSDNARTRLVACRAIRAAGGDVIRLAEELAADPSPMVRREIALSLRDVPADKSLPFLITIAGAFDGKDRAYLEALGLGATGKEAALYDALRAEFTAAPDAWTDAFAWLAWRLHPPQAVADQKARALSDKVSPEQSKLSLTALGFTRSAAAATAMIALANTNDFVHKNLANWWVNNRKGNLWKPYDVDGILKAMGQDPASVTLTGVEMPAEPANAPKLPSAAEIAKLPGDITRGKAAVAACYMCHRIGATGIEYGPDLTSYGKQQPAEVIIEGIIHPSSDISHGYEGTEIKTGDGLTIMGMILSDADPVIVKTLGGQTQTIARSRIAGMRKMEKSLMYSPTLLGLTAQGVADITAYLKSL
jgi:putative membrane-bound dehydrogenase-like protein